MRYAAITGWGKCIPPATLTNADLEKIVETSDDWITTRTGIKERHIAEVDTSDLATVASAKAMASAGVTADQIDMILLATCTPDHLIPSAASRLQAKLGAYRAGAQDLNAACAGFIYALVTGTAMIRSGAFDRDPRRRRREAEPSDRLDRSHHLRPLWRCRRRSGAGAVG